MSGLSNVTNQAVRGVLADRSFTAGGLAIDGANAQNVETTAAVVHTVDGVFQTNFPITAEIDLSALETISAVDGSTINRTTHAARASGDADETLLYVLACVGTTAYVIEPYVDVAAADDNAEYELTCPAGFAPFGVIKIVRDATDTAAFTLGSDTAANGDLDATGRTTTFTDVAVLPSSASSLA